jgi:hypothetical protein
MLTVIRHLIFNFLAAATGFISDKKLPANPEVSFNVTIALWATSYSLHYLPEILTSPAQPAIGFILNLGCLLMIGPRYGLALLMGWIFTDVVFLTTDVYLKYLDWWLLIVYIIRSKVKLPEELKK